jgi:hypothetical protein
MTKDTTMLDITNKEVFPGQGALTHSPDRTGAAIYWHNIDILKIYNIYNKELLLFFLLTSSLPTPMTSFGARLCPTPSTAAGSGGRGPHCCHSFFSSLAIFYPVIAVFSWLLNQWVQEIR